MFFHLLFEDVSRSLGLFGLKETGRLFAFLHGKFESLLNNYRGESLLGAIKNY